MSYLLDTDICSAYLRNVRNVTTKVMLHFGGLHISAISAGELLVWGLRKKNSPSHLQAVHEFLAGMAVHDVNLAVAERFASVRVQLMDSGCQVGPLDILNAAVALEANLVLVTHNVKDYANIDGLQIEDWLAT